MSLISRSRSAAGSAKHAVITRRQTRAAVAQARAVGGRAPDSVRVCWDLDNTLVDSGSLLKSGKTLAEAIVEAQPVRNMPGFFRALQAALPGSEHFILSVRPPSMRAATRAWLRDHLGASDWNVCLVPYPESKPKVWRSLGEGGRLVIVDDLSYGHEGERPSVYETLVDSARRLAAAYVGLNEIQRIEGDGREGAIVVQSIRASLETPVSAPGDPN